MQLKIVRYIYYIKEKSFRRYLPDTNCYSF